jgi:hypothetical protein
VENRQKSSLQFRRQVDKQVPAAHEVHPCERRIHDEVLGRKDHHLPDGLCDPIAALELNKEPTQTLWRHIRSDVGRVNGRTSFRDGVFVQIGGEDMERKISGWLELLQRLFENDGQRISLLPGRAAGYPGPKRSIGCPVFQDRRNDLGFSFSNGAESRKKLVTPIKSSLNSNAFS